MKRYPRYFLLVALIWVIGGSIGIRLSIAALPASIADQPLPTLAPMLERTLPAVVNIATTGHVVEHSPLFSDPFFGQFFDIPQLRQERRTQGLGSGVIVDAGRGLILTNHHVIEKADNISVTLHDGREFAAELVGTDPESDLALLKVKVSDLTEVPLGDSDALRVGDFVVAIGNPFGLGQTVTSGIVSALQRSGLGIESYENFIQTDASINPGNSGGALVNLRGELMGINTAIVGPNGGNVGIGFAIPTNMAKQVMAQLVKHGEVRRGQLGVIVQDLTPNLATAFGLGPQRGVVVAEVVQDSAADRAGLLPGDVITHLNGKMLNDASALRNAVGLLPVGTKVALDVLRDGKSRHLTAKIDAPEQAKIDGGRLNTRLDGAVFVAEPLPDGRGEGVWVAEVERGSTAYRYGLRRGDWVISVNRQRVSDLHGLEQAIPSPDAALLLNIRRQGRALFVLMQ